MNKESVRPSGRAGTKGDFYNNNKKVLIARPAWGPARNICINNNWGQTTDIIGFSIYLSVEYVCKDIVLKELGETSFNSQ